MTVVPRTWASTDPPLSERMLPTRARTMLSTATPTSPATAPGFLPHQSPILFAQVKYCVATCQLFLLASPCAAPHRTLTISLQSASSLKCVPTPVTIVYRGFDTAD